MIRYAYRGLIVGGGVGTVATVVFAFTIPHAHGPVVAHAWAWAVVVPAYLVGAFAVWARPDHMSARWLGAAGALLALETVARRVFPLAEITVAWWMAAAVVLQVMVLATAAAIASVMVVFPDTQLRYPYQRRVLWSVWLFVVVVPAMLLLSTQTLFFPPTWAGPEVPNPLSVTGLVPLGSLAETAHNWRVVLWMVGSAAMVVRYRHASLEARRQFRWPLAAAVALTTVDALYRVLLQVDQLPPALGVRLLFFGLVPAMILLSASILVALLRHRLVSVDLWLRRSILFGGTSVVIALAYLGLAGLLGLAAGQRISLGVGVLVTLAAVVGFYPARRRLDGWARRWVFGSSVAGTEVLRRVGDTLEDAYDVTQIGSNLVRTMVGGLDLEWARMTLSLPGEEPHRPIAAIGVALEEPAGPDLVVPLVNMGETVGHLECGPKRNGELTPADEALVSTVARQAALAVSNARLTAELENRLEELNRQAEELAASRKRIVQAQTEERHRIERNIHDGVQQEIIASIAKIRLARNRLARDPALAEETLAEAQGDAGRTLENLRELSRGIHPPVLTHRGLVGALRAQASPLPIEVTLEVTPEVQNRRLPEQVEETAYYVASEGLANVLKHARTDEATVRLAMDDGFLTVEVIDQGQGCEPDAPLGSGIVGLKDRVGSIGGELAFYSQPGAGTTLRAGIPAAKGNGDD